MKIRNLLVMTLTLALGTLSAAAQQPDGSKTFADHEGQSITISSVGTVLSFTNAKGVKTDTNHIFRICPCGHDCIVSDNPGTLGNQVELTVDFPKAGTILKEGETLSVTAIVATDLSLTRKLAWEAGSDTVTVDEIIATPKAATICGLREDVSAGAIQGMCPPPPGASYKCPPQTLGFVVETPVRVRARRRSPVATIRLSRRAAIMGDQPLHLLYRLLLK
ncbi:MAG: hypothetical protein ACRD9S_13480 [Pyrinomonadaceae bacterium]